MIIRTGKLFLRLVAGLAAGLAMVLAVAAWLVSAGPISLAFLTPYIQRALNPEAGEYSVDLADTILTWAGWERALDIRVVEVKVLDSRGRVLARVPEISLGLSGAALLRGEVAPTRLDVLGPEVRLVRRPEGRVELGFGADPAVAEQGLQGPQSGILRALAARLLSADNSGGSARYLKRISVLGADLVVDDRPSGTLWHAPRIDLILKREPDGVVADLDADLEIGGQSNHLTADAAYRAESQRLQVKLGLNGFEPAWLAPLGAAWSALATVDLPLTGSLTFSLGLGGKFSDLDFDLSAGAGSLELPGTYKRRLTLAGAALRGRLTDNFTALRLDEIFLDTGGPVVNASALVSFDKGSDPAALGLILDGQFSDLPVDQLDRFWPPQLAPAARHWVTTNVRGGKVPAATIKVHLKPGDLAAGSLPDEAVDLRFSFAGVGARYLRTMPELAQATGSARLTAGGIDLVVRSARVGALALSEGTVHITGFDQPLQRAEIGFVASGPVAEALRVLGHPPLGFGAAVDLDAKAASGQMSARAHFAFPLKGDLEVADVSFVAAANLVEFGLPEVVGGFPLRAGQMALKVDAAGLTVTGTGELNGVPVGLTWRRLFRSQGSVTGAVDIRARLDDAGRQALALPGAPYLRGPVAARARINLKGWQVLEGDIELDLAGTEVTIAELVWSKPAAQPGEATIALRLESDGTIQINSFALSAAGLMATGQAELGPDLSFRRLDFSRLAFGQTDVSASLRPLAPKGYIAALEGASFDMRPYLARVLGSGQAAELPPLRLSARLGRMILGDQHELSKMSGRAVHEAGQWRTLEASGVLSGQAPISLHLESKASERQLSITSPDAGAFARSIGVFDNALGGRLDITAVIDENRPDRPLMGRVRIKDYRVVNAPLLARILTIGSLTGVAELLNGEGISFALFDAPFCLREGRLTVDRARTFGPALGVTLTGVFDRRRQIIDMNGTLVPAYTFNSVLGKIPLLGTLLVGRQGEGVFAATFSVKGPASGPRVTVNPLSALAPGFLRGIVSGQIAEAATGCN
ncbi:MAG: AsmA-like C-terminal domain-containing protein [Alphaproteobacteria bacterium]|nr:AsmA-like C-terminal domain-containing protein [Alphaproteobacteria bacterium]MDP7427646.1 AsmA-like C-terminal domain-containing protein [Alphaproteobacteria bacterium]